MLKICTNVTATYFGLTKSISEKKEKESWNKRFTINPEFIKTLPKPITRNTKFRTRTTRGKRDSYIRKYKHIITLDKIRKAFKYLKNKKAQGLNNEMSKCFNIKPLVEIEELSSNIFDSGYYPDAWNNDVIYLIYKSGGKSNLHNFRVIFHKSLGKPFNMIQNKWLTEKLVKNEKHFYTNHRIIAIFQYQFTF